MFGSVKDRIGSCTRSLSIIQLAINNSPLSSALIQAEANYRSQLANLYWQEEAQARQQSRIKWFKDGDANTAFFPASIKTRRAKNTISNIQVNESTLNDNRSIS